MRTTEILDGSKEVPDHYVFHHSGGDGNVHIEYWTEEHYTSTSPAARPEYAIEIPYSVLEEFVGQQIIDRRVADLEQMSGRDMVFVMLNRHMEKRHTAKSVTERSGVNGGS
jgi:hypothetical protein